MTKAEMVRKLEKAYACEDYFPGVLGNPVTFAVRWGLPLSRGYLKSRERGLRNAKRRRASAPRNGNGAGHSARHTERTGE